MRALAVVAAEDQVGVDCLGRRQVRGRHRAHQRDARGLGAQVGGQPRPRHGRARGPHAQRQRVVQGVHRQRERLARPGRGPCDSPSTCWTFSGADRLLALVEARLLAAERAAGKRHEQRHGAQRADGGGKEGSHGPVLLATVHVVALFGPTGVGKTAVAIAARRAAARARRGPGRGFRRRAPGLPRARALTGAATPAEQQLLEHRLLSFVDPRETFSAGRVRRARPRRDRRGAGSAGGARSWSAGPASTSRPPSPTWSCGPHPTRPSRARVQARLAAAGPGAPARRTGRACARLGAGDRPPRPHPRGARARAARDGGGARAPGGAESRLWTARLRHPTRAVRPHDGARRPVPAHRRARGRDGGRRRRRGGRRADAAGAARTARSALGFEELLDGDPDAMKRRTRNYAKRQLSWMRRLPDAHAIDLTAPDAAEAAERILHILAARPGRP